jgi:hypothetical protein
MPRRGTARCITQLLEQYRAAIVANEAARLSELPHAAGLKISAAGCCGKPGHEATGEWNQGDANLTRESFAASRRLDKVLTNGVADFSRHSAGKA